MLTTAYDEWNRVIGVTHPDGSTALTSYSGNRATVADEAGKKKEMVSDVLGRLRSVREDPDGLDEVTSYSYDALNNLTQVVQGAQTRTFEYDSLGRLRRATNPEVGVPVAYEYDGNGNLAQKTVGGVVSTMSYDNLNRLWRKSYTDGTPAVMLCYDGQGMGGSGCEGPSQEGAGLRLTETHTSVSGTRYAYDTLGRVSGNEQRTAGLAPAAGFHYQYNADDSVASERYPSGQVVTTCYDSLGRVKWVSGASEALDCSSAEGPAGSYVTGVSYTHTAEGEQIGTALGNGLTEVHKRNRRGQVREVSLGTLWRLENHYGTANNGNVVKQVVGAPGMMTVTERYEYDGVNRLKTAAEYATDREAAQCPDSGSVWCQGWGYDRWGNGKVVASQNVPAGIGPVEYAGNNRIVGWGYERGNLVRDGLGQEFGYDAEERQKEAGTARYYYDGEGRRVKKEAGGRTTVYVYDGFGRLGAEYGEGPASGRRYLTGDHLGTVRVMTDQAGVVQERHDYLPYGEEILATAGDQRLNVPGYGGTSEVTQRFTGKERDGETGLDYFGARYYSGAMGRFTSPDQPFIDQDPADPQSWNLYAYGRNNPLAFVDPTGQYVCGSNISEDECANFQKSLDQAQAAANALKDKHGADSKQYTTAQRAIDAYGKAGVDNGVTVDVGNTGKYGAITTVAGAAGPKTADNPTGQKINVTFGTGVLSDTRPTLAAHEGSHVADGSDWVRSGFSAAMNPTRYQTEVNAYQVQSNVGQGLGWQFQTVRFAGSAPYLLNVQGWAPSNTSNVINAILKQQYGLLPTDQRRAFRRFLKVTR